jgi:hypothetical protein
VKKFFVGLIGGTILMLGLVMLILPGPGLLVIGGGLALLASEFLWARRALRNTKIAVARVRRKSGIAAWLRMRKTRCTGQSTNPP